MRSSWATPTRPASCRRCPPPTSWVATARTSCSASCTRRWRRTGATCVSGPRTRAEEERLGAKMVGRWQSGAPLAVSPDADDPGPGGRSSTQQRLRLRRRPTWVQVPGRCPRPPGQPARRPGPRGQRRRAAAPDAPARHQLRADAPRRGPRGRRCRPRDHVRLRRRAPQAAVRVREDPVAQRRHLHRRPARVRPPGRPAPRAEPASRSRNGRSDVGCRTFRRSWSPAAASTASRPA